MIEILRFQVKTKNNQQTENPPSFMIFMPNPNFFPGKTRKKRHLCLASLCGFPSNPAAPEGAEHQTDGNLWELERAWSNT